MTGFDLMVDIDEVIFPMIATVHQKAQEKGYHDGTAPMQWAGWVHYRLPSGEPCPEDVYWDLWTEFALEGGYVNTAPIPGAVEALRHLYLEGHRIHIVTARGFMANADQIRAWTPEWIAEWAVPHHSITFARDKVAVQEQLGVRFDMAIDDSPKNYEALMEDGIDAYLMNHQHNQAYPCSRRVNDMWEWAQKVELAAMAHV